MPTKDLPLHAANSGAQYRPREVKYTPVVDPGRDQRELVERLKRIETELQEMRRLVLSISSAWRQGPNAN